MTTPAWHIVTGEYPPTRGGVSDYSRSIALGLAAAHDEVHVWAPSAGVSLATDPGIHVHSLPQGFGPVGLRALSRALLQERSPKRILVQYVPQAFGWRGLNVPFCAWLSSLRAVEVFVMFHEVAVPWTAGLWRRNAAYVVMRAMAALLLARADRIFVSTTSWEPTLQSLAIRWRGATWLPVPSNVPTHAPDDARSTTRKRLGIDEGTRVIGHFGTYGGMTAPLVARALTHLLEAERRRVALLIGHGGDVFARQLQSDGAADRVLATGPLDAADIASHLLACDVLLQPYPDGVSTRRTSTMAGLALGVPIVTNEGHLTEPIWRESGGVEIVDTPEAVATGAERLLRDPVQAAALGDRGRRLYEERFSLDRVVASLRA